MIEPRATYRVQLQPDFDLAAAAELVEHLDRLGVSHLYLSPIAQAVPGSTHGYDVVDPGIVSSELGGTPALLELAETLRAHGMGLLVDIVPNHVAAHESDTRWWSLLGEGRGGPAARVFDVEWDAPGADGRVVLPMLGEPVADAIAAGRLRIEARAGGLVVHAGGLVLPVAGPAVTGDDVETVLAAQHYRLEFWRTGEQHLNYRRFFDIATLPAVRVEERDVFDTQHALVASLLDAGVVDGVRVDHVDGLRIPGRYLQWLRDLGARWIVVEKILARDETLPASWAADGTTGYEFAERAGGALVDGSHETEFTRWWEEIVADTRGFDELAGDGRAFVVERLFRADLARITRAFARAVGRRPGLERAIAAMLSGFDVYRTYVEPGGAPIPSTTAVSVPRCRLPSGRVRIGGPSRSSTVCSAATWRAPTRTTPASGSSSCARPSPRKASRTPLPTATSGSQRATRSAAIRPDSRGPSTPSTTRTRERSGTPPACSRCRPTTPSARPTYAPGSRSSRRSPASGMRS